MSDCPHKKWAKKNPPKRAQFAAGLNHYFKPRILRIFASVALSVNFTAFAVSSFNAVNAFAAAFSRFLVFKIAASCQAFCCAPVAFPAFPISLLP
jgi:hypothetical protein